MDDFWGGYLRIGVFVGIGVGIITFFGVWIAAILQWGWLLGIAFGWFPAAIIAAIAGF